MQQQADLSIDFAFRNWCIYLIFLYFIAYSVCNILLQTEETTKKIKKTKEKIMKQLKESIMSEENLRRDIKESTRNVKNSDEVAEVAKEMEKTLKSYKCSIL